MAAAFLTNTQINVFDQRIFNIIMGLKRKRKRADLNDMHLDIIKTIDFKDTTEEYLQDRIDINEKIIHKKEQEFGLAIC